MVILEKENREQHFMDFLKQLNEEIVKTVLEWFVDVKFVISMCILLSLLDSGLNGTRTKSCS
jgi:hypothetical protein